MASDAFIAGLDQHIREQKMLRLYSLRTGYSGATIAAKSKQQALQLVDDHRRAHPFGLEESGPDDLTCIRSRRVTGKAAVLDWWCE